MRRFAVIGVLTMIAVMAAGQEGGRSQGTFLRYNAAFYTSGAFPGTPRLMVCPVGSKAFTVALPFVVRAFTFSPDGRKLYAEATSLGGLFVIEFNPVRTTLVRGSESFAIDSVAVPSRADKIVISGHRLLDGATEWRVGAPTEWGMFELNPGDGRTKTIARLEAPRQGVNGEDWTEVSVSPDGNRAVAFRHKELELIDLFKGAVTSMGPDLEQGAWSPDGRWLAVNNRKKVRTILLDANTLAPVREVAWSHLRWSPDSRYLLGAAAHDFCGPYFGTFQAIDIETGKTTRISSSECKVDSVTSGWVSAEIR